MLEFHDIAGFSNDSEETGYEMLESHGFPLFSMTCQRILLSK